MKVISYCRVSSEEQAREGISLAAQEAKIRSYAELYGLEIVECIVDAGVSAKNLKRPGLHHALALLDAGEAEGIVVLKLDRLTRSVSDWATLIEGYFGKQYALLSVSDQIDTRTAAGRLVLNVLISVAQWEREAVGERTSLALQYKKAQGEYIGGIPFGFTLEGGKLAPMPEELSVTNMARQLREQGATLQQIADELNAKRIATKTGKSWHAMSIKRILERAV